jgi:hypothetical protein
MEVFRLSFSRNLDVVETTRRTFQVGSTYSRLHLPALDTLGTVQYLAG